MNQVYSRDSQKKVLIVEDELIIAKGLEKQLKALGYSVVDTVPTGKEALEKALEELPDLVLMDINLKGDVDGVWAAGMIRLKADIPVVYITAYADPATLERAKITEPFGYIVKPFQEIALKSTIEMALYKHVMESRIRKSEQFLSTILRSIGDAVIATDEGGVITFLNPVAEELTGWRQEDAFGMPFSEVFVITNEKTGHPCEDPIRRILGSGIQIELENHTLLVGRDGKKRFIADSGTPIRDRESGIVGAVLIFRDITEKKKMEAELLMARQLESIGILAGGIAHDFNNLLTAILGNISLAKMFTAEGDNIRQKLADAEKASLRARDLTQQLLTFSRGGAPVKQTTGIADIIKESAAFTLSGSRTLCCFDLREDLWPIEVDVGQISQVINNLIINADQAMPEGGVIDVICRNVQVGVDDLLPIQDGRYVKITVRDHGVGIPPDSLGRIFDPYYTTKKSGKGLGLATVYSIIKNHDGYIDVKSEIGEGSVFTIYLPCAPEGAVESAADERHPVATENVTLSGRILVMDDEENIRDVAGEMLDFLGYDVEFARDGGEAVDLYEKGLETSEPFSAVLLDLTVPGGMGGKEAMDFLRKLDGNVKGIASSGYSNDPIMSDYRTFGFCGIISKPYKLEEFKRVFEEVIGEGKKKL